MKKYMIGLLCIPVLFLTGCSSENIADRIYTRAIGLSAQERLTFSIQPFEDEDCRIVRADSIADAIQLQEADAGGRVFIGHTELICLDGSCTLETVQTLFYEQCLSPGCKVLFTSPEHYLRNQDGADTVHTLRMSEQNGLLASTDLSTVLEEWLGEWETALLPTPTSGMTGLVLVHKDGTSRMLSEEAAAGMYWLRRNKGNFSITLGEEKEVVEISRIRLTRKAEEDGLHYAVHIRTKNCPEELLGILEETVLGECHAAIEEMRAAQADVIGMQEILEAAGMRSDLYPEIMVTVTAE